VVWIGDPTPMNSTNTFDLLGEIAIAS
jgi:hypothetical protein